MPLGLAVAGALLLAGCASTPSAHDKVLKEIVYVNPLVGDPLWNLFGKCMTEEGNRIGIKVRTIGPPGDKLDMPATENMVSQAITNRTQAIVTWSFGAPAAFDALLAKARAAGVLTATLLSAGVTKNQDIEFGDVFKDDEARYLAAIAARPGHQYVAMLGQYDNQGVFGSLDEMRQLAAQYTNVTIVDGRSDNGVFANDVDIMSQMMAAHPEVNVLASYNGYPGTLAAIKERRTGPKTVAFMGYLPGDTQVVRDGIDAGIVGGIRWRDLCGTSHQVVDRLKDLKEGRKVASYYDDGFRIVTGDEFKQLGAEGRL